MSTTAPSSPPSAADAPASLGGLLWRLLALGWRYRAGCLGLIVLNALLVAFNLAGLSFIGLGIDVLRYALQPDSPLPQWPWGMSPPNDWGPRQQMWLIAGCTVIAALLNAALKFANTAATAALSQSIVIRLRSDVYDKLQRLSFRFFDANDSSAIINRVAGDVQAVRSFVDGVAVKVVNVLISLAVYLSYMLAMNVSLTLACLFTTPFLWLGAAWFATVSRAQYLRSSELGDTVIRMLVENVQGIAVVKGFGREAAQIATFRAVNERVKDQKYDIFWRLSLYQPTMGFLTQLNLLILIAFGGTLVISGQFPLGAGLFVFANLLQEFANQISQITNIANSIQISFTGAERVFAVLDAPLEITSKPDAIRLPRARGEIRFEHVTFGYDPARPVLNDVSFVIPAGACVGIAGETGAGKSTLLTLITRFYDVQSGRVRVDGIDVRDLELSDLRRNIGLVFQESFLFSNTVATNIAFGQPAATRERIEAAAKLASASEFIDEMPERYQSLVGEHGVTLSGGQRQRLAIARAVLLDPPILIFDDALSAVDPETEHEIERAIAATQQGRTTLLVSSRISTLQRADHILMFAQGRLVESGSHHALITQRGPYQQLAELQRIDPATIGEAR